MIFKLKGKIEYQLLLYVAILTMLGLIVMYSASSYIAMKEYDNVQYFLHRQFVFVVIGFLICIIVSFIDYRVYKNTSTILYIASLVLIILTLTIGKIGRGSSRWFEIKGITFQSSEIMKISLILFLSTFLNKHSYELNDKNIIRQISLITLIPIIVISINNLSTAIILFFISLSLIFVVSKKMWPFAVLLMIFVIIYINAYDIALVLEKIGILKHYQILRILAWKDPLSFKDTTFQTMQGLYAVGSGGMFGRGLGASIQKSILPEPYNDMIFAIICEELGLVGGIIFIGLYIVIITTILYVSNYTTDLFGKYITFGIAVHILLQVILNISVVLNLIPNTGITLPFVSYGGSSLIILFVEIGIVLNVSKFKIKKTNI